MFARNSPLQPSEICGVYTALITPMYKGDGLTNQIDYDKLSHLIDDQAKAGVSGVVLAGTTGQSATLDHREQVDFVGRAFDYIKSTHPQLQVIVGAGSNCTREALNMSRAVEERIGPSTFLHVTGYYNKPTQAGIEEHFRTLAKGLPKSNILVYDVPSRVVVKVEPRTLREIVERTSNVVGIKEAYGDKTPDEIKSMLGMLDPKRFVALSGEDNVFAQAMEAGAKGIISASANVAPKYFVKIAEAAQRGYLVDAKRLQDEINPLVKAVFRVTNPIPLAMLFNTSLRLPLVEEPSILSDIAGTVRKFNPKDLGIDLMEYQ
jgi:4-hydroxy-tetrahydrodipicolinate synthase